MFYIIKVFTVDIGPFPKQANISETALSLSDLVLKCQYADTKQTCKQHVFDNFAFYKKTLYPREAPYTPAEYQQKGESFSFQNVNLEIQSSNESYQIQTIQENYTISVTSDNIKITAVNSFAASRAFATLAQLVRAHLKLNNDKKAYSLYLAQIEDFPETPWRHVMVDGARHYIPLNILKEHVDALSISKFNVLELNLADRFAFSVQFQNAPQNQLFKGGYKHFYYKISELHELKEYAFVRGVFFVPRISMPDSAAPWAAIDKSLVAKCNPASKAAISLNPISDLVFTFIEGIFSELLKFADYIHLDNSCQVQSCWNEDPEIKKHLSDRKISVDKLYQEFIEKITKIAEKHNSKVTLIFYNYQFSVIQPSLNKKSIIQIDSDYFKKEILAAGFQVVHTENYSMDLMAPNGPSRFYQDTYQNLYKVDIYKDVPKESKKLVIGGGAVMWGDQSCGKQAFQQLYPRAIAISNTLWRALPKKTIDAALNQNIESVACVLDRAGLDSGVIVPGRPCFGHAFK